LEQNITLNKNWKGFIERVGAICDIGAGRRFLLHPAISVVRALPFDSDS
jgi:hypothetical protein